MPFLISLVLGFPSVILGAWGTFPDDLVASIDFGVLGEDSRVTCNIAIDDFAPLGTDLAPAGRGMPFVVSRVELTLLRSTVLPDALEMDGDGVEMDGGVERLSTPLNWRRKEGLLFVDTDDEASLLGGARVDAAACVFRSCSALTTVDRTDDPEGCSFAGTSPGLKFLNSACFLELVASLAVDSAGLICLCLRNRVRGFAPTVLSAASSVSEVTLPDLRCAPPSLTPAEGAAVEVTLWGVHTFGELAIVFDDITPPEETEVLAFTEFFRNLKLETGFAMSGEEVADLDPIGVETGELDAADATFSTELADESRKSLGRFGAGVEESFVSAARLRLVFSVGESTVWVLLMFDPVRRGFGFVLDPCEMIGVGPEIISTSVDDAESMSIGRAAEKPDDAILEDLDFSFSTFLGLVVCLDRRSAVDAGTGRASGALNWIWSRGVDGFNGRRAFFSSELPPELFFGAHSAVDLRLKDSVSASCNAFICASRGLTKATASSFSWLSFALCARIEASSFSSSSIRETLAVITSCEALASSRFRRSSICSSWTVLSSLYFCRSVIRSCIWESRSFVTASYLPSHSSAVAAIRSCRSRICTDLASIESSSACRTFSKFASA